MARTDEDGVLVGESACCAMSREMHHEYWSVFIWQYCRWRSILVDVCSVYSGMRVPSICIIANIAVVFIRCFLLQEILNTRSTAVRVDL